MMKHQATIKEIAHALGVAVSTVSRALQNDPRIGLRTKMRVNELAQKLHYVPNPAAKLLRQHRTMTIGVVLPFLKEEFFSLAISGIEDVIAEKGYNVFISQSRESYERELKTVQSFKNSRVDGVIASIAAATSDCSHFHELQQFGIPIVFFDRVPKGFPAHQVRCNTVQGVKEAMYYLLKNKGKRRIALLNGPETLDISQERLSGYLEALKEHGISPEKEYIKFTDLSQESTRLKMKELADCENLPEAIVAFNDYIALYAMQWCKQEGIEPNKDILFVSFANLPITSYIDNPPIASIDQFAYLMGQKAAEIMMDILESPQDAPDLPFREIMIDTKLVERNNGQW